MRKTIIAGFIGMGLILGISGCSQDNIPMAKLTNQNIILKSNILNIQNENGILYINGKKFLDDDGKIQTYIVKDNKIYYFIHSIHEDRHKFLFKVLENNQSKLITQLNNVNKIYYTKHNNEIYLDVVYNNKDWDYLYKLENNKLKVVDKNVKWEFIVRDNWNIKRMFNNHGHKFYACKLFPTNKKECWENTYLLKENSKSNIHYMASKKWLPHLERAFGKTLNDIEIIGAVKDYLFIVYPPSLGGNRILAVLDSNNKKVIDISFLPIKQTPYIVYRSGDNFVIEIESNPKKYFWLNKLQWIKGIDKNFKRTGQPFGIGGSLRWDWDRY